MWNKNKSIEHKRLSLQQKSPASIFRQIVFSRNTRSNLNSGLVAHYLPDINLPMLHVYVSSTSVQLGVTPGLADQHC